MNHLDLSAIVLCYRAEESALQVVEPLRALLRDSGVSYELVLVANYHEGQADRTPTVVEEFATGKDDVVVVARPKEGAMGWDMRSGLAAGQGSVLVVIDGDSQNPVGDVLEIYRRMRATGAAVMKGRRSTRLDGLYRRVLSFAYNALFRLLFGTRGLWDINGKPKGITRGAYEHMTLTSDDWFIDAQIVLEARRAGLRVEEFPVSFERNEHRASFVRLSAVWEFLTNMVRERLRRRTRRGQR